MKKIKDKMKIVKSEFHCGSSNPEIVATNITSRIYHLEINNLFLFLILINYFNVFSKCSSISML